MTRLLLAIPRRIYSPAYYREHIAMPFGSALWRYLSFFYLIGLIAAVFWGLPLIPKATTILLSAQPWVNEHFPADMAFTIQDGVVKPACAEPYLLPLPQKFLGISQKSGNAPTRREKRNLLVIDTATPFSLEAFERYDTVVWLLRDSVAFTDKDSGVRINSLQGVKGPITIDKAAAVRLAAATRPYIERYGTPALVALLLAGVLFITPFVAGFYLFYLLFGALVVWLIARLRGMHIGYGGAYRAGMYLMTLPIILDLSHVCPWRFTFTALLTLLAFLNLKLPADDPAQDAPSPLVA